MTSDDKAYIEAERRHVHHLMAWSVAWLIGMALSFWLGTAAARLQGPRWLDAATLLFAGLAAFRAVVLSFEVQRRNQALRERIEKAMRENESEGMIKMAQPDVDWTNGFPFESDKYYREFEIGTVLDGDCAYSTDGPYKAISPAINQAVENSTDGDIWAVFQTGAWNQDGTREAGRIVALIHSQEVFLVEPRCRKS